MLKTALSPAAPIIPATGEKAAAPPLSIGAIMLAGGTAGVAMWSVAIPPDVSRRHVLHVKWADYRLSNRDCNLPRMGHILDSWTVRES